MKNQENKNKWLGYSERGLLAAWFQDLCNLPNAPKVFQQLEGMSDAPTKVREAIRNADAITTLLEPSFAGFGDPDGIIVFRRGETPLAAIYIEAKRGPLATEWNDDIVKKKGKWKSSHLVVQIARRFAFIHALSSNDGGLDTPIRFQAKRDYWKQGQERKMQLKKHSVLHLVRELGLQGIPSVPVTLTSSAYVPGQLSGDNALSEILKTWELSAEEPVHIGFDNLLSHSAEFPLLRRTFDWNWSDTIVPTTWDDWRTGEPDAYTQSLEQLREWAGENRLEWCESGPAQKYLPLRCKRLVSVRLFGCYGPGGPILDMQLKENGLTRSLPTGWRWWGQDWDLQRSQMRANETWNRNLIVPDTWPCFTHS